MLVSMQGFGSIWEQRVGRDPSDPMRYSHRAAFYNTTGIKVGDKYRHRWKVGGKIRFQGGSAFDSARLENNINKVFECDEPEQRCSWMQMCCKRRLAKPEVPDWFLFCVTTDQVGWVDMRDRSTRSDETYVLSYSGEGPRQELLMLMKTDSWVLGSRGRLLVETLPCYPWQARLVLVNGEERSVDAKV
jgi:hypothetical protein